MNNSQPSRYIVWCPTSSKPPTVEHSTIEEAYAEAKRLADLNPNKEFRVMRTISSIQRNTEPYVRKTYIKDPKEKVLVKA